MQNLPSKLAQLLLDAQIRNPLETRLQRRSYWLAEKMRRTLLACMDPPVRFEIAGSLLQGPFSHNLPVVSRSHPTYNTNLSRVAAYISDRYPDLTVIDIGANIGDSVAYIRRDTNAPILCLEGNKFFFNFLRQNIAEIKDVVAELVFVSSGTAKITAHVHTQDGTSRLEPGHGDAEQIATQSLTEIVEAHPRFLRAKLLKIDTDGFDIPIIRGALNFLVKNRPALFFEYDPAYFLPLGEDGLSIFPQLQEIGYRLAFIYDNLGDLLLTCSLDAQSTLEDVHRYFTGRFSTRYCDICIFAEEDLAIADAALRKEREFYEKQRGVKATPQQRL